jgi:hypothetical protein
MRRLAVPIIFALGLIILAAVILASAPAWTLVCAAGCIGIPVAAQSKQPQRPARARFDYDPGTDAGRIFEAARQGELSTRSWAWGSAIEGLPDAARTRMGQLRSALNNGDLTLDEFLLAVDDDDNVLGIWPKPPKRLSPDAQAAVASIVNPDSLAAYNANGLLVPDTEPNPFTSGATPLLDEHYGLPPLSERQNRRARTHETIEDRDQWGRGHDGFKRYPSGHGFGRTLYTDTTTGETFAIFDAPGGFYRVYEDRDKPVYYPNWNAVMNGVTTSPPPPPGLVTLRFPDGALGHRYEDGRVVKYGKDGRVTTAYAKQQRQMLALYNAGTNAIDLLTGHNNI